MAQKSTTLATLKRNQSFCLKKKKLIAISKCDMFNCDRSKACIKKSNNDFNKSVKR